MHVLFTSWAWEAHLAPLVPLGWALGAAGHEVMVAGPPSFAPVVTKAGLPALPCGPDIDLMTILRSGLRERGWRPGAPGERTVRTGVGKDRMAGRMRGFKRQAELVADTLADELLEFAIGWRPDLVVFEPTALVGPLVAEVLGIPSVRGLWATDFTSPANGFDPVSDGELAKRFGLESFNTCGTLTLDTAPPALRVADGLRKEPMRYIPYNGASVIPKWLWEKPRRRPRICVSWGGTLDALGFNETCFAPNVVRALGEFDVEIVIAVAEAQLPLFDPLPDNVIAAGRLPLHAVLPHCTALVHQGGGGTTMTALCSGVRQLTIPYIDDGAFHSQQLERADAAIYLRAESTTPEVLREGLARLIEQPGTRAEELRAQMERMPAPAELVTLLSQL